MSRDQENISIIESQRQESRVIKKKMPLRESQDAGMLQKPSNGL